MTLSLQINSWVHYNLVKAHQALGCTLLEATGNISLNGFKWLQILQNSI